MIQGLQGSISRLFAERRTRRRAIGAGLLAAGATGALRFGGALAQDGSPVPVEASDEKTMFLFVQAFEGGTWTPNADGTFTLTVSGGVASTIYFSDRPERVFGASPTQLFLDGLSFSTDNPPNAAIVVNDHGVEDIVVVELFDPVFADGVLTYTVRVLEAYDDAGLGDVVARKPEDNDLPAQFGEGALFIDDCPDGYWEYTWNMDDAQGDTLNCSSPNGYFSCVYNYPSCDPAFTQLTAPDPQVAWGCSADLVDRWSNGGGIDTSPNCSL